VEGILRQLLQLKQQRAGAVLLIGNGARWGWHIAMVRSRQLPGNF
jgi:hypothetical protein